MVHHYWAINQCYEDIILIACGNFPISFIRSYGSLIQLCLRCERDSGEFKSTKAVSADGISPLLLRLSAPIMADEITGLINFLIADRSWPNEQKCGNLTPVLKKDEDTRKENYRPVSVLLKVYKEVMYDQLYNTFCGHLSQNLSGFLKNHSRCTAPLKMTEDLRRSLDNRESAMAVAIDLSKAFDFINYNLLLANLKALCLSIFLEFDVILSTGS